VPHPRNLVMSPVVVPAIKAAECGQPPVGTNGAAEKLRRTISMVSTSPATTSDVRRVRSLYCWVWVLNPFKSKKDLLVTCWSATRAGSIHGRVGKVVVQLTHDEDDLVAYVICALAEAGIPPHLLRFRHLIRRARSTRFAVSGLIQHKLRRVFPRDAGRLLKRCPAWVLVGDESGRGAVDRASGLGGGLDREVAI
jgi:hypothetical protein